MKLSVVVGKSDGGLHGERRKEARRGGTSNAKGIIYRLRMTRHSSCLVSLIFNNNAAICIVL
jgi:hypothetical protein